jgi:hypothetical protein
MEQTAWLIELLDQLKGERYHHTQEELTTALLLADDAVLAALSPAHRETLCRHISRDKPPMRGYAAYIKRQAEFTLAALHVLQFCGTSDNLPTLRRLSESVLDARIRNAATLCVEKITGRSVNEAFGEILLRPAHSTGTDPDELLRAAAPSASQTSSAELLRASSQEPAE